MTDSLNDQRPPPSVGLRLNGQFMFWSVAFRPKPLGLPLS